jgi:phosphoribosylformimino-5-aminoimidazole carboxamide ribonucleotide (ProFAR) isomerase
MSKMPRLHGAIIGKALYDGRITGNLRQLIS